MWILYLYCNHLFSTAGRYARIWLPDILKGTLSTLSYVDSAEYSAESPQFILLRPFENSRQMYYHIMVDRLNIHWEEIKICVDCFSDILLLELHYRQYLVNKMYMFSSDCYWQWRSFVFPTLSSSSITLNSNLLTSGPAQIKSKTLDITKLCSERSQQRAEF